MPQTLREEIHITSTLTPEGDRTIAIRQGSVIIPLLITKKDLKAYRLYRSKNGKDLEAIELVAVGGTRHTPISTQ